MANRQSGANSRKSIRPGDYDYTQSGAYFITICTHKRLCLLAEVIDDKSVLNEYGLIVEDEWYRTAQVRPEVTLDAFVVMPNHIHGIILIDRNGTGVTRPAKATQRVAPTKRPAGPAS
jgi:REP element-mobilizing transposase RayT